MVKVLTLLLFGNGLLVSGLLFLMPLEAASFVDREPVRRLQAFAGSYRVVSRFYDPETQNYSEPLISDTEIISEMDGTYLSESGTYNLRYTVWRSYDQFQKCYRFVFIDDFTGLLDVYEGHFDGQRYVLTNLASGTFVQLRDRDYAGRLTYETIDTTGFTMRFELSPDNGQTWQPYALIRYDRLKEYERASD